MPSTSSTEGKQHEPLANSLRALRADLAKVLSIMSKFIDILPCL